MYFNISCNFAEFSFFIIHSSKLEAMQTLTQHDFHLFIEHSEGC